MGRAAGGGAGTDAGAPGAADALRARSARRRRRLALIGLSIGQLLTILDATAVNVALPSIQRDLHISQSSLSWVVNAYLLTFGGILLVAGRLGDLVGRKKIFVAGVAVFALSSLCCGLATSSSMLAAARFFQGIGAAVECAMVLGILVSLFPDPRERAGAVGVYAFVGAAGGTIGLLVGGAVTEALGWHWIFFINLPFCVIALIMAVVLLDEQPGLGVGQGVDVLGGTLITAAAVLAVYGSVQASTRGWGSVVTLGCLGGAAALGGLFVVVESHHPNPLVPMRVLRSRNLVCMGLTRALFCFGSYGSYFLLVLYLQQVLRYGPVGNGLAFLPSTIGTSVLALFVAPRLMARIGGKPTLVIGLVCFAGGIALLTFIPVGGHYFADVFPAMAVLGIGSGVFNVTNVTLAMDESVADDSGLVSGVINVAQQLGAALGVAVLASVSDTRTRQLSGHAHSAKAALTAGFHSGFVLGAASLVVAAAVALFVRPPRRAGSPLELRVAMEVSALEAL